MTTTPQDLRVRIFNRADWESYYGPTEKINPRVEEILLSACPFNKGKLVAETHFAFVGMPAIGGDPLTVAKWLKLHPTYGQPCFYFYNNPWHVGQPHTDVTTLESRLYIVLREIVPGSTGKTPEEQVVMLPPEYEVPSTIAEVTKDILVYRRTGKRSNSNVWAACAERTAKTDLVDVAGDVSCVGKFSEGYLSVARWDNLCRRDVGVGASRKIPIV